MTCSAPEHLASRRSTRPGWKGHGRLKACLPCWAHELAAACVTHTCASRYWHGTCSECSAAADGTRPSPDRRRQRFQSGRRLLSPETRIVGWCCIDVPIVRDPLRGEPVGGRPRRCIHRRWTALSASFVTWLVCTTALPSGASKEIALARKGGRADETTILTPARRRSTGGVRVCQYVSAPATGAQWRGCRSGRRCCPWRCHRRESGGGCRRGRRRRGDDRLFLGSAFWPLGLEHSSVASDLHASPIG